MALCICDAFPRTVLKPYHVIFYNVNFTHNPIPFHILTRYSLESTLLKALPQVSVTLRKLTMSHQYPSIQSFFPFVNPPPTKEDFDTSAKAGDGFTAEEIEAVIHPKLGSWVPQQKYVEVEIGSLVPGYQRMTFMGRIVNFYDQQTPSKMPNAARGCLKVVVKDGSGALVVGIPRLCNRDLSLVAINRYGFRSSSGTPTWPTTSAWAISSRYGRRTCRMPTRALSPCRTPLSSLPSSLRETGVAIL